jgi:hypothetical protein
MTLSGYSDVFEICLERHHDEDIVAGDIVRTGVNLCPQFEVIAISGLKAWVRNIANGEDHLALISRCRKIADSELRQAAE